MDGEDGEGDAEGSADERENADFGQGRLQKMGGRGAEGGADGGLAVAADEASELRVCQIDARDEEDAEDSGHEKPEPSGGAAYDDLFERLDVDGECAAGIAVHLIRRDLPDDVVGEDVEIFRGLSDRYAGLQTTECDAVAVVAVPSEVVEVDHERCDDFGVGPLAGYWGGRELGGFGKVEVLRQDADDLVWRSGDLNGPSDDGGVAVEETLPESVTDDGDLLVAFDGLFGQEIPALRGLDAEDVEQVGLGDDSADEAGVIGAEADAGCALLKEGEIGEGGRLFAPEVGVAGIGSGVGEEFFEEAYAFPDDDEAPAVAVGEGLEEDAVDDAEEGGGGSDAEARVRTAVRVKLGDLRSWRSP